MSRERRGHPDYPVRFQNQTGDVIPPFGLMQLVSGSRLTSGLSLTAATPAANGEDALFVNSPTTSPDGSTTGACRSVYDGPFWVAVDAEYAPSDIVGPIAGSYYAGSSGSGFKVLFQHESLSIALCDVVSGSSVADDGFPSGTGGCDCGHCVNGTDLSGLTASPTICCTTQLAWSFVCPWTGIERRLKWIGVDQWATDSFAAETDVGCSNEYQWLLEMDAGTISLTLAVDNGCDKACIVYEIVDWIKCNCDNEFRLRKFDTVDRDDLACKLCIKPLPDEAGSFVPCNLDSFPKFYLVDVPAVGTSDCTTGCSAFEGTYALLLRHGNVGPWWVTISKEISDCTLLSAAEPLVYEDIVLQCATDLTPWYLYFRVGTAAGADSGVTVVYSCGAQDFDVTGQSTFTFQEDQAYGGPGVFQCDWPDTITVSASDVPPPVTSDGSCAGCGTPDTAPIDDEGSCCATGSCLDISQTDCASIGGTWYATDAECDAECDAIGSCCTCIRVYGTGGSYTDQKMCVSLLTQEECERSISASPAGWGGVWSQNDCGDGTGGTNDCGGVIGDSCTLGEQLGACCDGGTCAVTNDADCTAWYSGVDCTAVTCNVGACCQCSGVTEGNPCECADGKTSAECTALNGIFLGLGSTCAGPENQCNVNTCTGGTCTP